MKRIALLAAGLMALAGCNLKSQSLPGFAPRMASADWQVLGRTNHEECGTYVFIDWAHLFKNEAAAATAGGGDITSLIASFIPSPAGTPEARRALYHALEKVPEATHLLEPRVHVTWKGFALAPVLMFGQRCATVDAHGVRIGERPVPNAQ